MHEHGLIIGGKTVPGAAALEVINPATGQPFTACARADAAQVDEAIAAALAAFPAWRDDGVARRREHLLSMADALEAQSERFVRLLTLEQGKPLAEAGWEFGGALGMMRALAEMDLPSRLIREDELMQVFEHRTALGVVAAITPWNFPLLILVAKLVPALLAGNTVVAKPAPTTPLTTLLLGKVGLDHLPRGVFNVIIDHNDLGAHLTSHPDVAKVAFTGSTVTGRKVLASGAGTLKRITLELGGNDPAIVLPDVDPASVATRLFAAAMNNAGQVCIAVKRLYVHACHYETFCHYLGDIARNTVVGDGSVEGVQMGPVHNVAQLDKVRGFVDQARCDGLIVAGGKVLNRPGYFVQPTIVRDINDEAQLVREEQFGPVLPVLQYNDVEEAIERANSSDFGLGASVWSNDLDIARGVAFKMSSGTVWINKHLDLQPDLPLRGARQSGLGAELGQEGLHAYTQAHVINVAKEPLMAV